LTDHFFKCSDPDCKCFFLTQHDLNKHVAKFGEIHASALKEMHNIAENHYATMEFNDADKLQQELGKKVLEHYGIGASKR
jgi:hypothetical protein